MMLCLVLGLGASAVKVSVDENVEFVSSMCRLAGFDEYVNNVNKAVCNRAGLGDGAVEGPSGSGAAQRIARRTGTEL